MRASFPGGWCLVVVLARHTVMASCEAEYQNTWWRGCARLRRTKGGRLEAHWDYGEAGSNFKEKAVVPGGRGMCTVFNRSAYHTKRLKVEHQKNRRVSEPRGISLWPVLSGAYTLQNGHQYWHNSAQWHAGWRF